MQAITAEQAHQSEAHGRDEQDVVMDDAERTQLMAEVNGVEDFVRIRKDFVDEGADATRTHVILAPTAISHIAC
ncbi:hypothetical protein I308_104683 [Cryptococcus tetragattii IND107]|uniref:Uncharacterized protein n=1 Tax=Cryptococcus tetragattii IND107 TaxID=1296105 RepID=A0ABR3BNB1_9TREE